MTTAKRTTRPKKKDVDAEVSVDLDALIAEAEMEPFTFRFGGHVYEMKNFALLPIEILELVDKIDDAPLDALWSIFESSMKPSEYTRFRAAKAPAGALMQLIARYGSANALQGNNPGESSASTDS